MGMETVKEGDSLLSLALRRGLPSWEVLFDHPRNRHLSSGRPDPNVLYPGEKVFLPDVVTKQLACASEKKHVFVRKRPRALVRVVVEDDEGEPVASKPYRLVAGALVLNGDTDADGVVEEEVPHSTETATLEVWADGPGDEPMTWDIVIGRLPPIEDDEGLQQRLVNPGYDCGGETSRFGPDTEQALRAFQREAGLAPTGVLDDDTMQHLDEYHDRI